MVDSTKREIREGMDRQLHAFRESHFKQVRCFFGKCWSNCIGMDFLTFIWTL